ncbi:cation:proton antiporter [Pararhizobium haloflavum]|uniref:cation:proton antiporter n=1 Tax=Pararhizobium haloflavum TaxID=2037914 RepID=UPI000C1877AB|nr:cation:proton antiporter [Pararhizobium haloflavum]
MDAFALLDAAIFIALFLLSIAFFLCVYRVVAGPTLPDRVLALDMLVAVAIGYIAVIGIFTGFALYVDIAIALGLVGFLATVAFARFILVSAKRDKAALTERTPGQVRDTSQPLHESGEQKGDA